MSTNRIVVPSLNGTHANGHANGVPVVAPPKPEPAKKKKRKPKPPTPTRTIYAPPRDERDNNEEHNEEMYQRAVDTPLVVVQGLLRIAAEVAYRYRSSHSGGVCRCKWCKDISEVNPLRVASTLDEVCRMFADRLDVAVGDRLDELRDASGVQPSDFAGTLVLLSKVLVAIKRKPGEAHKPIGVPVVIPAPAPSIIV